MGRSMAHIAHQPGPVCLEGGVSRWLVRVVGLGAELQRPHTRGAWGASSIRVPKKNARCQAFRAWLARTEGLAGMAELRPLSPGGPGGAKPLLCHNSKASSNVQEEDHSCARGQVEIARPLVLTPPRRYRRYLVSKGRFTISTNDQRDLRGNPFKPPEKAISRGDGLCRRPSPPPRQGRAPVVGCLVGHGACELGKSELPVGFRGCCVWLITKQP
jgi:hypothetical protein